MLGAAGGALRHAWVPKSGLTSPVVVSVEVDLPYCEHLSLVLSLSFLSLVWHASSSKLLAIRGGSFVFRSCVGRPSLTDSRRICYTEILPALIIIVWGYHLHCCCGDYVVMFSIGCVGSCEAFNVRRRVVRHLVAVHWVMEAVALASACLVRALYV